MTSADFNIRLSGMKIYSFCDHNSDYWHIDIDLVIFRAKEVVIVSKLTALGATPLGNFFVSIPDVNVNQILYSKLMLWHLFWTPWNKLSKYSPHPPTTQVNKLVIRRTLQTAVKLQKIQTTRWWLTLLFNIFPHTNISV